MSSTIQLETFKDITSTNVGHNTYQEGTKQLEIDRSEQVVVLPDIDLRSPDMPQRKEGNKTVYMKPLTCIMTHGTQPGQVVMEVSGLEMFRVGGNESSPMLCNMYKTISLINDVNGDDNGAMQVQRISYVVMNKEPQATLGEPTKKGKNVATPLSSILPSTSPTVETFAVENGNKCTICGKLCKSEKGLAMHTEMLHPYHPPVPHEDDVGDNKSQTKMWLCEKCPFKTCKKYKIPLHLLKHKITDNYDTDDKGYISCKRCTAVVSTKEDIYKHLLKDHEPVVRGALRQCWICTKVFADQRVLNRHITEVHEKVKPYPCNRCGLGFQRQRNFLSHQERSKRLKYVCSICLKHYRTRCDMEVHCKAHDDDRLSPTPGPTEEPPSKKSKATTELCKICNKYIRKSFKTAHMKEMHDFKEEFKCQHCGKVYNLVGSLRKHVKQVHVDRKCAMCGEEFATIRKTEEHVKECKKR